MAYSLDGHSLISTTYDDAIQHLDPRTGIAAPTLFKTTTLGNMPVVALSPVDGQIAFGTRQGDINLWNCQTGATENTFCTTGFSVAVMTFSPCGRYLASTSSDHAVRLWDRYAPENESFLVDCKEGQHNKSYIFSFSSTGHELAVGLASAAVELYDTRTRCLVRTITLPYEKTS